MRKNVLCLLLLVWAFCVSAETDILFNLNEFGANPATNRPVTTQQLQPFPANLITNISDPVNGIFYLSNAVVADYAVSIRGVGAAYAINFQITVTATNLGVVDAANITSQLGIQTYPTAGKSSWTIKTSDQRYQLSGTTLSNTFYPLFANPSNYVTVIVTTNVLTNAIPTNLWYPTLAGWVTNLVNLANLNTNTYVPGTFVTTVTNAGAITFNVGNFTNGHTPLVFTNPYSVLYTNALPQLTNNFVDKNITNNAATIGQLNSATNGVPDRFQNTSNFVVTTSNTVIGNLASQTINGTGLTNTVARALTNTTVSIPGTAGPIVISDANGFANFKGNELFIEETVGGSGNMIDIRDSNNTSMVFTDSHGNLTASNFIGNGWQITNANATNLVGPALAQVTNIINGTIVATSGITNASGTNNGTVSVSNQRLFSPTNFLVMTNGTASLPTFYNGILLTNTSGPGSANFGFFGGGNTLQIETPAQNGGSVVLSNIYYLGNGIYLTNASGSLNAFLSDIATLGTAGSNYSNAGSNSLYLVLVTQTNGFATTNWTGLNFMLSNNGVAYNASLLRSTETNSPFLSTTNVSIATYPVIYQSTNLVVFVSSGTSSITNALYIWLPAVGCYSNANNQGTISNNTVVNQCKDSSGNVLFTNPKLTGSWTLVGGTGAAVSDYGAYLRGDGVFIAGLVTATNIVQGGSATNAIANLNGFGTNTTLYFTSANWGTNNVLSNPGNLCIIIGGVTNTINNGTNNTIIGGYGNVISGTGMSNSIILGGMSNSITGVFSTFGTSANSLLGGTSNTIGKTGYATISGGFHNTIGDVDYSSGIFAGNQNTVAPTSTGTAIDAVIIGGVSNSISATSGQTGDYSAIVGGQLNNIGWSRSGAIVGGFSNILGVGISSVNASIVLGGFSNVCGGNFNTFLGGGNNQGIGNFQTIGGGNVTAGVWNNIFVWSDGTPISPTANEQIIFEATNGFCINTNADGSNALYVGGNTSGLSSSWPISFNTNLAIGPNTNFYQSTNLIHVYQAGTALAAQGTFEWGLTPNCFSNRATTAFITNNGSANLLETNGVTLYSSVALINNAWTAISGAGSASSEYGFYQNENGQVHIGNFSVTNFNAITATLASYTLNNATNWLEPAVYYVSPTLGNDSNSGRNRSVPFATYTNAADVAFSNAPATIVLMAGNYNFPGTFGDFRDFFIVPPFVNVIGEQSNNVIITCTNTSGTFGYPDMQPDGTNQIKDVNFTFQTPISSDLPLGNAGQFLPLDYVGVPWPGSGTPTNILAVSFPGCTFRFQGTGIHFEGIGITCLFNWDFDRCHFFCNNNWIQLREAGPLITVENSDVTLMNWTNVTVINAKPLRLFESRTVPNAFSNNFPVRVSNTKIHYADTELSNSNRPVFLCWNTQALTNNFVCTNIFQMSDCSLEALSLTNPSSMDLPPFAFNTSTQCVVSISNVRRIDNGGILTMAPGYSARTLFDSSALLSGLATTNNPLLSGGFWTNTFFNGFISAAITPTALTGGTLISNISSGEYRVYTNLIEPQFPIMRCGINEVIWVTNLSGSDTLNGSWLRP